MQGLRKHAKMVRLRQKGSGKLSKAFIRGCDIRFALRKDPSGCCVKKKTNKQDWNKQDGTWSRYYSHSGEQRW